MLEFRAVGDVQVDPDDPGTQAGVNRLDDERDDGQPSDDAVSTGDEVRDRLLLLRDGCDGGDVGAVAEVFVQRPLDEQAFR